MLPATIADPSGARGGRHLPGLRISLSITVPHPTVSRGGPLPGLPSRARFRDRSRPVTLRSRTGEVVHDQSRQPSLRCLIRDRAGLGATDREMLLRTTGGPQEAVSQGQA